MLTLNKNMKLAIATFNRLSPDKAQIILSRIFASPTSDTLTLFSSKEKTKLLKLIQITEPELQNMLRAFSFLLMHAVAERNFPELQLFLQNSGMNPGNLEAFSQAWVTFSNDYAVKIREKQAAIRSEVKGFNWNMGIGIEDSRLPIRDFHEFEKATKSSVNLYDKDERNPKVQLNLLLSEGEEFALTIPKADVQSLFETFERIQDKLDNLL